MRGIYAASTSTYPASQKTGNISSAGVNVVFWLDEVKAVETTDDPDEESFVMLLMFSSHSELWHSLIKLDPNP